MISLELLKKYNVPVPRYTSYPTVPFWQDNIDAERWKTNFSEQFHKLNSVEGISVYIHLPFCESLCTYCGCNKKITQNHSVEDEYINAIVKEWKMYRSIMKETPLIRSLHLGGGTPTFFSPVNLQRLLDEILKYSVVHPNREFSFEGHPNNTTKNHLKILFKNGFNRVSFGVQDHDPEVQRIINRIQPFENVQRVVEDARAIGYESVNFDLIYGLPLQTMASMERTIEQSISLNPDRIAFYSYAHVPWKSRGQRLFDENDLPLPELKMQLYVLGKQLFTAHGYTDIGMDHFALPNDELYKAWKAGKLYRNFMGYTTQPTNILLGLGVSSISDSGTAFAQNQKTLHDYYADISKGILAVTKGYFLTEEDMAFKQYILNVSCKGATTFRKEDIPALKEYSFPELKRLEEDKLIEWNTSGLKLTETGRHFTRNVCRAFDLHLLRNELQNEKPLFSKAV